MGPQIAGLDSQEPLPALLRLEVSGWVWGQGGGDGAQGEEEPMRLWAQVFVA